MDLERIHDYAWRIPKHGKMRVDGIIFASRRMLDDILKDESVQQVINVATLPGIVRASLAMPDIHWGYGFPIGGVAAFDADEGIISPGGVGYDVNCLTEYSMILDSYGCKRPVASFQNPQSTDILPCLDKLSGLEPARIKAFIRRSSGGRVIRLTTESGKILEATREHPVLTPSGMIPIGEIAEGEDVAVYHFEGVPFEPPQKDVIVDDADILSELRQIGRGRHGNSSLQVINYLRKKGVLPLRYDSPQLPHLLRILGFIFGDGTLYLEKGRRRYVAGFYGKEDDLRSIRYDVLASGFTPSPIYHRDRRHSIQTHYNVYEFERRESFFFVRGNAFGTLMSALCVPVGRKAEVSYKVPRWVKKAQPWQRRLFLAALFGAELSTPRTMTGHGRNFNCPVLDMNKREGLAEDGRKFLGQISRMLRDFGVETLKISERKESTSKRGGLTCRLRLMLSGRCESLVNLYGKIGFEYNKARQARGAEAAAYLKFKERHLILREQLADNIRDYVRMTGTDSRSAYAYFKNWAPNLQFVQRSMSERSTRVRVVEGFQTLEEFTRNSTAGLGGSGCVWESVIAVDEEPYDGPVYDFTMDHPAHNFIADGFVVSNCGVRLLRSDLAVDDVRPRMREIVNQLFRDIPTGVGSHHKSFKLGPDDEKHVLKDGAEWAVSHGYGEEADLAFIESAGCLPGADPQALSDRAKQRGRDQLGTLGSGNHFVEVEEVVEIYDEQAANVMGLFPGQVVITVHTGSRGLGHQVCEDNIERMLAASRKYGIELPDKQLCCAPVDSPEGRQYFAAMAAAANFAFANRQVITHWVRQALEHALKMGPADHGIRPVYDVCHNIAKFEEHMVGGSSQRLCVHRKGATRAYPARHPEVPAAYRGIGQPVLIPGDMGRYSFVLVGTAQAMEETFGSTCHGAGRLMSRHAAKRACRGRNIEQELAAKGIVVRGASRDTVVEEVPEAYKDVAEVVDAVVGAGISRKVAKLKPMGVIKG